VKFPSKKQKNILDTGFRRYDESKENEFQLPFLGLFYDSFDGEKDSPNG